MSLVIGIDTYADEAELTAYAAVRGVILSEPESILLIRAMDWLELQPFCGKKTDPDQPLQFPRDGSDTVPINIKKLQLVCAMIYEAGGDPLNTGGVGAQVISESVAGAIKIDYSDRGGLDVTYYPQLEALLRPFVCGDLGTNQFKIGAA